MPTALVLTAHGDDMEFFAGGTIAKLCARGWDIHLVISTDNARGTFELSAEAMFGLRMKEAEAAGKVLGLKSVVCLDYGDGYLGDVPQTELRRHFLAHIRKHRPEIVFTFDPWAPFEGHPDHRAVGWAAHEAASFSGFPLYEPQQLADGVTPWYVPQQYYFAKSPRDTNRVVDIAGDPIRRKVEALYCFDSQMVLTLREAQLGIETAPYDIPEITGLDPHDYHGFIDQRVRRTAAAIGRRYDLEYAEHFRRTRWGGSESLAPVGSIPEDDW